MKFRIVEKYNPKHQMYEVQVRYAFWPFWMDAWEDNLYFSIEEAKQDIREFYEKRAFKERVVG